MRILITGAGTVGMATGEGLKRFGHDIVYYDHSPERIHDLEGQGHQVYDIPLGNDLNMICVGAGDLMHAIERTRPFSGLMVVRTTTAPGTITELSKEYGIRLAANPEFLTERNALWDFMFPDRIVIGCEGIDQEKILTGIYTPFRRPIVSVDVTTAEMIKMASNLCLAAYISYWNEIAMICEAMGIIAHDVSRIACMDHRISEYGTLSGGDHGGCLNETLDIMINYCKDNGIEPAILMAVRGDD